MIELTKDRKAYSVWYKRYAPYVIEDEILPLSLKNELIEYCKSGKMQPLGFWSTKPGLGKTSTAEAIARSMDADVKFINASLSKGIDVIRNEIATFCEQRSLDDRPKLIILDECDHITKDAQAGFRGFIDKYCNICNFIFTGNYKSRMLPPLLDRLKNIEFQEFDEKEMKVQILKRLEDILETEGVEVTDETRKSVCKIIKDCYPCIRSMINCLQSSVSNGVFNLNSETSSFDEVIDLMRSKDYLGMIGKVNVLNSCESMYEYLYNNVDKYFSNIPNAIMILGKGQFQSELSRDKRLNLSSTLVELIPFIK